MEMLTPALDRAELPQARGRAESTRTKDHRESPQATGRTELSPAAALFHSLSDPARLAILRHLADAREARVIDLTDRLGLAQSTVSKHLSCLRDCGLVEARAVGRASLYSLTQPSLLDLLAAAETLLEATGNAVTLCPVLDRN